MDKCHYCDKQTANYAANVSGDVSMWQSIAMIEGVSRSKEKCVIGWSRVVMEIMTWMGSFTVCAGCVFEHRAIVRRVLNERFSECKIKSDQLKQVARTAALLTKTRKALKTADLKACQSLRRVFEQEANSLQ